jgi:hypothetical protein
VGIGWIKIHDRTEKDIRKCIDLTWCVNVIGLVSILTLEWLGKLSPTIYI